MPLLLLSSCFHNLEMLYLIDYTRSDFPIRARFEQVVNKKQTRLRRIILLRNKKTVAGVTILEHVSFVAALFSTNLLADLRAVG